GRGPPQSRVLAPVPPEARPAVAELGVRQRGRAEPLGPALRARLHLAGAGGIRTLVQRQAVGDRPPEKTTSPCPQDVGPATPGHARHNVQRLHASAAAGTPILACEPSCILTIKDDYPALLRGEERQQAEIVARMCRTVEEVLETAPGLRFLHGPRTILVQAHCH